MKLNKLFFTIIIFIPLCFSCRKSKIQVVPNNDINTFMKYVKTNNLKPLSALWLHKKRGEDGFLSIGSSDYELTSVLQFSPTDWLILKDYYCKNATNMSNKTYLDKNFIEYWFPKVANHSFILENNFLRPTCEVYDMKKYLNGSFSSGACFFLDENYVIIIAQTN